MLTRIPFITSLLTVSAFAGTLFDPFRLRVNTQIIQQIFHSGDERVLDNFKNISIQEPVQNLEIGLQNLNFDVQPKLVPFNEYDFILSLKDPNYDNLFGFIAQDLTVTGQATSLDGNNFEFQADVTKLVIEFVEQPESNQKILAMKPDAKEYVQGKLQLEVGQVISEKLSDDYLKLIQSQVGIEIEKKWAQLWSGNDINALQSLPVESLTHLLLLKHMGSLSTTMDIQKDFIEYGFDPEIKMGMGGKISIKKQALLKEIESSFKEVEPDADPIAISMIIDENFFNTFFLDFVIQDTSFSLEKYLKMDPRTESIAKSLNTVMFESVLPDFYKSFGRKKFDVMLSLSHNLLKDKIDGMRITGLNFDKNGNFRFTFNIYAQIIVDMNGSGQWVNGREIYLGLTYKGKLVIKEENGQRNLVIVHKSAEVSGVKILNEDGEEAVMEQMMITSGLNVQFEQMIKMVPPKTFQLKNPPTPKELECFGFKFSNIDLDFKKGYIEASCGFQTVDRPSDPIVCQKFMDALRNGPNELMEMADKYMQNPNVLETDARKSSPKKKSDVLKQKQNKKQVEAEVVDLDSNNQKITEEL